MLRFLAAAAALLAASAALGDAPVVGHDAQLRFDLASHRVDVIDRLTLPAGVDTLWLCAGMLLEGETGGDAPRLPGEPRPVPTGGVERLQLQFSGVFLESTDDVVFSRENVGREIQATIGEEGIYLAADAWLPRAEGALNRYRLQIATPPGWEPVTQGRRVRHDLAGSQLITTWEAEHPADGIVLIANRYHVTERDVDGVVSYTFFLEDDPRLVETYQERTAAYLAMYDEMIGPYPYAKFATVENWFPTGYGMPSWTLLGGTVLRLPFIPYTSFGHEIAHNWWGNSAFVDVERGNWCEGLTVWCADYHYKELESDAEAREYRRNLLKDYAAYVREGRDLPLREFRERHSGATRAIGYGKGMMVFHMLDRLLGREAFLSSLREVWAAHPVTQVSWDDFLAAFGERTDRDLAAFGEQWLGRTGAPTLRLAGAVRDGDGIRVDLVQDAPAWSLEVPVVAETPAGPVETVVTFDAVAGSFLVDAPDATAIAVDPDYHVFRRLHPEEIEPTLSRILGDEAPRFVLPQGELAAAARTFAADWIEDGEPVADDGDADHSRILVNPDAATLAALLPAEVRVTGGLVFLEGRRYALSDHDAVFAVPAAGGADLVVLCRSASRLEGLASRLSHYGKYSWLVMPVQGRPLRGNWSPAASPLRAGVD
jgi:hypothetical protein